MQVSTDSVMVMMMVMVFDRLLSLLYAVRAISPLMVQSLTTLSLSSSALYLCFVTSTNILSNI